MSMKKPKIFPLTSISTGLLSQVCVFSLELSEKDGYGNLKLGQTLVSTVFFSNHGSLGSKGQFRKKYYQYLGKIENCCT